MYPPPPLDISLGEPSAGPPRISMAFVIAGSVLFHVQKLRASSSASTSPSSVPPCTSAGALCAALEHLKLFTLLFVEEQVGPPHAAALTQRGPAEQCIHDRTSFLCGRSLLEDCRIFSCCLLHLVRVLRKANSYLTHGDLALLGTAIDVLLTCTLSLLFLFSGVFVFWHLVQGSRSRLQTCWVLRSHKASSKTRSTKKSSVKRSSVHAASNSNLLSCRPLGPTLRCSDSRHEAKPQKRSATLL